MKVEYKYLHQCQNCKSYYLTVGKRCEYCESENMFYNVGVLVVKKED